MKYEGAENRSTRQRIRTVSSNSPHFPNFSLQPGRLAALYMFTHSAAQTVGPEFSCRVVSPPQIKSFGRERTRVLLWIHSNKRNDDKKIK